MLSGYFLNAMKMREIRNVCEANNRECDYDNYRQIYQVDGDFVGTIANEILNLNCGQNINNHILVPCLFLFG